MSSADYPDLTDILAAMFESLLDEEPWAAFLERLRPAARATWATLILTRRDGAQPGIILTPNADPDVGLDYAQRLFAEDPFTGLPEGKAVHFRDFVSPEALKRRTAFGAFMAETGGSEVIGVELRHGSELELRLRLTRRIGEPPFAPKDIVRLQGLVPHLRTALRLFERLATGEAEQRIYAGAVAQMAIGMVILDQDGLVLRINAQARAILADEDGIALRRGRIEIADPALARQLRQRLADPSPGEALTLRIDRRSGAGGLVLVAGRADTPDHVAAGGGPAAVLFLNDLSQASRVTADAVRELLGLTQAEASVAALLANGGSIADAADGLGISPNTVRAHLRSIFAKTGVKRQSQLVQLVHHSLPALAQHGR